MLQDVIEGVSTVCVDIIRAVNTTVTTVLLSLFPSTYLSTHGVVFDRGEGETIAGGLDEVRHFRFTVSSVKRGVIGGVRREEGDRGEGETIAGGLDELGHFRFTVSSVKRGVCERGEGGGKRGGGGEMGCQRVVECVS